MFKKTILTLIFMSFIVVTIYAQGDGNGWQSTEAVSRLTANSSKRWVFIRSDAYMGTNEKKCTKGEEWKFLSDGRLSIIKCVSQKWVETEKQWSLTTGKSRLDLILKIDEVNYVLVFPANRRGVGKEQMILRIKAEKITKKTKDLIFYSEVD